MILLIAIMAVSVSGSEYATKSPPSYVSIDNGIIATPEVRCGSEDISLHFRTEKPFTGRIFVKGHVGEAGCVQQGDGSTDQSLVVRFDSCGVRRQREINGVVIIATAIVSFHSIFITKIDRAYKMSCFYLESTKVVNTQVDVGSLTTELIKSQVPIPTCRYEILSPGPDGNPVSFARIGDTVYHKWSCEATVDDVYCMRVHSCTVYDGQGGSPVTVVDINGCSVDPTILRQLSYTSDLSAGQDSAVFKFADRVGLYFNCQIQLTLKERETGCAVAQPDCGYQAQVEPSTIASEEVEGREEEEERDRQRDPEKEHESGYPTRKEPYTGEPSTRAYANRQPKERMESSAQQGSGEEEEYAEPRDRQQSAVNKPPYVIRVNPFDVNVVTGSKQPASSNTAHPPGVKPNFNDQPSSQENPEYTSREYSAETEEGRTPAPEPEPYTRLIRRRARARSPGKTVHNASSPLFVADFDLPERSLMVLGIDEGQDTQSLAQADRLFNELREPIVSCSSTGVSFAYSLLMTVVILTLTTAVCLLAAVVVRQRKLLKNPLF